jgi:hypothetical protein
VPVRLLKDSDKVDREVSENRPVGMVLLNLFDASDKYVSFESDDQKALPIVPRSLLEASDRYCRFDNEDRTELTSVPDTLFVLKSKYDRPVRDDNALGIVPVSPYPVQDR